MNDLYRHSATFLQRLFLLTDELCVVMFRYLADTNSPNDAPAAGFRYSMYLNPEVCCTGVGPFLPTSVPCSNFWFCLRRWKKVPVAIPIAITAAVRFTANAAT